MALRTLLSLVLCCACLTVNAEFVPESVGSKALDDYQGKKWFWTYGPGVPFELDSRAYLFNAEGDNLAQMNNGIWINSLQFDHQRNEILAIETYFSRGSRGDRSDMVSVYDPKTMAFKEEIAIPPKRMTSVKSTGVTALSDDNRFLIITNYTPAQSISVVDLETRQYVTEIETPGCSVVYPAGNRDFYAICGNGGFLQIRLDDTGNPILKKRHAPVFDPVDDFLTIAASRHGDTWYFVSFDNNVHAIRMDADGVSVSKKWSLVSDEERADNWRISGMHHTAIHQKSGRLFMLMHQGEAETFEQPGEEVWVYDLNSGEKINVIELDDIALSISVSQDDDPTLYSLAFHVPLPTLFTLWIYLVDGEPELMKHVVQVVDLYDADSGEHQNKVGDIPRGYLTVVQPW